MSPNIRLSTALLAAVFLLFPLKQSEAVSNFHFSTMVNYELTEEYWPGWDLTLLYNNQWGVRYTNISDVLFLESKKETNDSLDNIELAGELRLPMILRTMDYNTFEGGNKTVFDFITAYMAFGYNSYDIDETHKVYSALAGNLVKDTIKDSLNTEVMATAIGIYGGERFLVIDTRILYYRGETKKSNVSGDKYTFNDWMLVIRLAIF